MSSDYLNYELSKELHDLGVVFETKLWHMAYRDGTVELTDYATPLYYKEQWVGSFPAPSTARLIDKLFKFRYLDGQNPYAEIFFNSDEVCVQFDLMERHEVYPGFTPRKEDTRHDQCATTALGKALIALVKEGK